MQKDPPIICEGTELKKGGGDGGGPGLRGVTAEADPLEEFAITPGRESRRKGKAEEGIMVATFFNGILSSLQCTPGTTGNVKKKYQILKKKKRRQ